MRAGRVAVLCASVVCSAPSPLRAQDVAATAGEYCLVGVHEVGSCIRLSPDGKFEYFLAYGAYDETSEGGWRLDGGAVVVDSLPYDRRPSFTFKRVQRGDAYDIVVESSGGRPIQGIDVMATCDGRTIEVGATGAGGWNVDCRAAPVSVALGLRMYGLAYQTIAVPQAAGTDRVYVFQFDPGDLGSKRFVAHRLQPQGGDSLVMIYTDTHIRELDGRPFRYVRQR
jgi:hypothetical protein